MGVIDTQQTLTNNERTNGMEVTAFVSPDGPSLWLIRQTPIMNEIDGCAVVRASLATLECMLRRHCTTDRFSLWILGAPRSQS